MNRKMKPEAGETEVMAGNALDLLKKDHRTVSALFKQFEEAGSNEEKVAIAQQVCTELTVHAEMEERDFYPAARELLQGGEAEHLVDEAAVEHGSVKMLIAQLDGATADAELFEATMKVLKEYVEHHVKEEERELFPKLKGTDLDLDALGMRLAETKAKLLAKVGEPRHRAGAKPKVHVPALTGRASTGARARSGAASKGAARPRSRAGNGLRAQAAHR